MYAGDNIYNIATCWKIETQNKGVVGITNHTSDLIIDEIRYHSKASFTPNELKRTADLKQNFLSIDGMLSHDLISKEEIDSGVYDNAKINIFLVDYLKPEQLKVYVFSGFFGRISFDDSQYQVELYSAGDALSTKFGDIYSSSCRAEFCDKKCKLDIKDFTFYAAVISTVNEHEIMLKLDDKVSNDFTGGIFEYKDKNNFTKVVEIFHHQDNLFKLKDKVDQKFSFGDRVILKLGCDKKFKTCKNSFNNIINFRGEPHVPTKQFF